MVRIADDLISMLLRIGEASPLTVSHAAITLAFACVVAGLTGEYLHSIDGQGSDWSKSRFIYTEVVAAFSILLALLWLLPFSGGFIHWPVDFLLFIAWIVAFGLLVQFIGPLDCGSVFYWGDITQQGVCQRWKADVAFAFLSAIFWLASALLGLWYIHRSRRTTVGTGAGTNATYGRRRWYRSHRV